MDTDSPQPAVRFETPHSHYSVLLTKYAVLSVSAVRTKTLFKMTMLTEVLNLSYVMLCLG